MFNVIEGAFQIFMEQEMLHSLKLKLKVELRQFRLFVNHV